MPIFNLVYEAPSWPELKSYEEIIAMSADNAVTELNLYPTEYYDKLNSEWHIVSSSNLLWYSSTYYYYIYNFADGTYKEQYEAIAPWDEFVRYNNWWWTIYT